MTRKKVLFLASSLDDVEILMHKAGSIWKIVAIYDNQDLLPKIRKESFDFILFDFEARGRFPPDIVKELRSENKTIPLFLFSRFPTSVPTAKFDFFNVIPCFPIPYNFMTLHEKITLCCVAKESSCVYENLFDSERERSLCTRLRGESKDIKNLREFILRVSQSDKPVLLYGETGTGKEVTAHLIHDLSTRFKNSFIAINTGNIPENLAESLLCGVLKGSYTDAIEQEGLLAKAHEGTFFLDEIENMSLELQKKFLRIIETKEFYKLGSLKTEKADFRVICATNKDLQELIRQNLFREDLYYRLDVLRFFIPPLRNHKEDIYILAYHYLEENNKFLSVEALKKLEAHDWPGNVRELHNCLERACFNANKSNEIQPQHITF